VTDVFDHVGTSGLKKEWYVGCKIEFHLLNLAFWNIIFYKLNALFFILEIEFCKIFCSFCIIL
jgi:hypothetical protein